MKKNQGFALLMAVIVTGTLLLIVYALSNISLKELILTHAGRESQIAFYAADTGVECAMFWDLKNPGGGGVSAFDPFNGSSVIECNGNTIQAGVGTVPTVPTASNSLVGGGGAGNPTSTFYINLEPNVPSQAGACAIVRVGKHQIGNIVRTIILSRGYNTCDLDNARRLERGLLS